ncbi:DUF6747 family protein [Galbibacter orientalis]|uniref:Uncharacterized protein n=1 Tax=Galbibacter orientalis DSM 19592 TaxID=926559 RepID=I3C5K5_9FLAO|nr:DUF6747 family protein [Galbibacter orientalis]EIJ38898.1 hypothetical protein JoomaDRAFT_1900 [Galbibacter orientalis DSM 19592]
MTTLLLLKELYVSSFSELKNGYVATFLKVFSWFCFAILLVVIYAFFYRLFTGFPI